MPLLVHIAFLIALFLLGSLTFSHIRDGEPGGAVLAVLGAIVTLILYSQMMIHW